MHLVFVILNSFLYSIRLLHRNHKPHDRKCQSMRRTKTPYTRPRRQRQPMRPRRQRHTVRRTKTPYMRPRRQRHTMRRTETPYHAPAPSASNHAPAPHTLTLTHCTKLRAKKTGRQPARADCPSWVCADTQRYLFGNCFVLQLSVSLQGVVSVNSFSVDYDKCSDLVVVGLACLQGFRIRVACVRCCEVRFFAKTGVLLCGSENFIAVNIYAVRCSPNQSDDLCLFVEFCREFLALFSILSLAFSTCLF